MNKRLNTEIIAVGTELLLGQITNTNARWISEQLARSGINTFYHTVVGDNKERLTTVFKQAMKRSNVVIITGGLGPTEDDLSREAFQDISNLKIHMDEHSLNKIKYFYEQQGTKMTPNNKRQARVFEDSVILENKVGMAPGNIVTYNDVYFIFLPGVPREMKQIFSDSVIPFLKNMNGEMMIQSLTLRFIGIGESVLEHKLQNLIKKQNNPTIAPLTSKDGITIRLTAKATTEKEITSLLQGTKEKILQRVGEFYYGSNDFTIEEKLFELLQQHNKHVAVAESLTGGLVADRFVSLEGASNVFKGGIVCYDAMVKQSVLKIQEEIIQTYGTVSEQCAEQMAKNVAHLLHSSIGLSFTGIAGPDTIEAKDVGTVFICLYDKTIDKSLIQKHQFQGDRKQIRARSVLKGLEMLFNYLK